MQRAQNFLFSHPLNGSTPLQLCQVLLKRLTRIREVRMARTPDPDLILSDATLAELIVALQKKLVETEQIKQTGLTPELREFLFEIEAIAAESVDANSMKSLDEIRVKIQHRLQQGN